MKHFALSLERISGTVQSGAMLYCNAAPSILPRNVFAAFSTVLAVSGRTKCHPKLKWLKILSFTLIVQLVKAPANFWYSLFQHYMWEYCRSISREQLSNAQCVLSDCSCCVYVTLQKHSCWCLWWQAQWQGTAITTVNRLQLSITVCPLHTSALLFLILGNAWLEQWSQLRCLCTVLSYASQSACIALTNGKDWLL